MMDSLFQLVLERGIRVKLQNVVFICLLGLGISSFVNAQCIDDKSAAAIRQNVDKLLNDVMDNNHGIPGISLNIQMGSKCKNFNFVKGDIAFDSEVKLKPSHAFRIASNTKTYTAATVLRLYELGLLDIELPIGNYLPNKFIKLLKQYDATFTNRTVRSILNHTSGLAEHTRDKRYFEHIFKSPNYHWTAEEQVQLLIKYDLPLASANSKFSYSDTGYILLGEAIQHITKQSLAESFRTYLSFERLNINESWHEIFEKQPQQVSGRVHQYYGEKDTFGWSASLDLYGGGGLVTTSEDLSDFLNNLMNGHVFEQAKTLELMKTVPPVSKDVQYSMGLFKKIFNGVEFWGHTGFWNTFSFYSSEQQITISGAILQKEAIKGTELVSKVHKIIIESTNKAKLKTKN
jgi:D-alanyl-D-alanine carboxypeptidase